MSGKSRLFENFKQVKIKRYCPFKSGSEYHEAFIAMLGAVVLGAYIIFASYHLSHDLGFANNQT